VSLRRALPLRSGTIIGTMGFEIVVVVFAVLSFFTGLIFPVVGWALLSGRKHQLLLKGIEEEARFRVTAVAPGDAATPARFRLQGEGKQIELSALMRGTTALWKIEIARAAYDGPHLCIVEQEWADAGASRRARELCPVQAPLPLQRRGFATFSDEEAAAYRLMDEHMTPLMAVLVRKPGVRELSLAPDGLMLAVGREGLRAEHAIAWLDDVVRLLHALDGEPSRPLLLLPASFATGVGGSSVGIPGAPQPS
jgi:hypothetical protein